MIKINLAQKKQAAFASSEGGTGTSATTASRMNRVKFNLEDVQELRGVIVQIVVCIVVALAANWWWDGFQAEKMEEVGKLVTEENRRQAELKARIAKTSGYEAIKKQLDADEIVIKTKIDTIHSLMTDRRGTINMLMLLSDVIPPNVWLERFTVGGDSVSVSGNSMDLNLISDFMKSLSESALFEGLNLSSTEQRKVDNVDLASFSLTAKVRKR
ncbi:MAG: PilN domain-containing protein [Bacteriovoracia bacterium]